SVEVLKLLCFKTLSPIQPLSSFIQPLYSSTCLHALTQSKRYNLRYAARQVLQFFNSSILQFFNLHSPIHSFFCLLPPASCLLFYISHPCRYSRYRYLFASSSLVIFIVAVS